MKLFRSPRRLLRQSKIRARVLRYWGLAALVMLLTLGLLLLPRHASAATPTPISFTPAVPAASDSFKKELWLVSGFWSHHTSHEGRYREENTGFGVEWAFAQNWQFNVGRYNNSVYHRSNYLQFGWMPLDVSRGDFRARLGASVGVVNGYPRVHGGGYFPAIVPAASLEFGIVGVNVVYIPSVGATDGAIAAQVKLRLH